MTSPITPYSGSVPNPFTQSQPAFDANTQSFVDYITRLPGEINQFSADLGTVNTNSTSTTSNTIGTGSKAFTVETGKSYFPGQSVTIARTSAPTNRMFAVVDSYNSGSGALVVTSQAVEGSGTFTDWTITLGFNGVIGAGQIDNGAVTKSKLGSDVAASSSEANAGTAVDVFVNPKILRENAWVYGSLVATTSGDPIEILTGLPAWVTEIELMLDSVSLSGTNNILVQLGNASSYVTSGYQSDGMNGSTTVSIDPSTSGFILRYNDASFSLSGPVRLVKGNGDKWYCSYVIDRSNGTALHWGAGIVDLGAAITRIRVNTDGANTFDAGSIIGRYR